MKCLKCNSDMEIKSIDNIEIDLCTGCGAIMLDDGEFESFSGIDPKKGLIKISRFTKVLSKLNERATLDELTGVYTRKYYVEFIKNVFENKNRPAMTFISIDIDHFKSINDTYGHDVGDTVLKEVAKKLKSALRVSRDEYLFRLGGEEFLIVLFNLNYEDSYNAAETLRKIIEAEHILLADGTNLDITISLGVAFARKSDTQETLYKRTDKLLYQAKDTGRNKLVIEKV